MARRENHTAEATSKQFQKCDVQGPHPKARRRRSGMAGAAGGWQRMKIAW
jgi:hypothetical protein